MSIRTHKMEFLGIFKLCFDYRGSLLLEASVTTTLRDLPTPSTISYIILKGRKRAVCFWSSILTLNSHGNRWA